LLAFCFQPSTTEEAGKDVPSGINRRYASMDRFELWLKGIVAAAISGGAGGVLTGLAAVGIDPQHFNLQTGMGATLRIAAAAALINSVIGVAAYLQKSPLPNTQ
jgi:Zn-dependent protease